MSELLTRDTLVINQKAKLIELTNEYRILDEQGTELGVIRQEGQSTLRKALRFVSNVDQFLTHKLAVYDRSGGKVVELMRPAKIMKSTVEVSDGTGRAVGKIVQKNVFGKKRFALEDATGQLLGAINAENWRAWDFAIEDATGTEVGRITKKWAGLLREGFTTADNYVLNVNGDATGDLRLLMLASAAGVDLALKQDDA
jgi:uncharacterized protein YxjI